MKTTWNQEEAINLCIAIEHVIPKSGCHVALTGGNLYRHGERQDLDLVIYRIRQSKKIDMELLFAELGGLGIAKVSGFGWCHKCEYEGKKIDLFFPEEKAVGSSAKSGGSEEPI